MLRIIQNSTSSGAKSYYSTADYYSQGQELQGVWRGQGAERLGLHGVIRKQDWDLLCDNRDPNTGRKLTVRQKSNRRVGYDLNWHCPKSVSVLYGLTQDERIVTAFRDAVDATMQEMEAEVQTRVRKGGKREDRTTGNVVGGLYVHTTARPVAGEPDPHLHAHAFWFNSTWDPVEERWKAAEIASIKRDAPYFEAVFHSRLSRNLAELGLPIERTKKGWELAGMPKSMLQKFSRRTAQIEQKAKELGITDPDEKGELGAKTRSRKAKELSLQELQELWQWRLSAEEADAVQKVAGRLGQTPIAADKSQAIEAASRAIDHVFERQSVVTERTLAAAALKGAYGTASREDVEAELARRPLLVRERNGQRWVTTQQVLEEEKGLVGFARAGRGTVRPLAAGEHVFQRDWLNQDQRRAIHRILNATDRVVLLRGGAGTGKTALMQEAVEAIQAGGHEVFAFAPSADASRGVLRSEGFATADTVARLLLDERLQEEAHGQVLWIDEAGLLSSRTMAQVFDVADKIDARVILAGDVRQHGSVERGSVLRLLEEEAGLVPAEIREIQRQKGDYKQAVLALSEGKTRDGFQQLDRLGWVREVGDHERYQVLASDYVEAVTAGKTALVVSPTHREGDQVTAAIRSELHRLGRLGQAERTFFTLENRNLTAGERRDAVAYGPGDVLVFHQNAHGHKKGARVVVEEGRALPIEAADRFQVFQQGSITLAQGDLVRVTHGGFTLDKKHKLENGSRYTVRGFDDDGNLVLTNGWTIGRDFGHLSYGYCATSHASQGRTVDRVFVAESSQSLAAASREQFYVSLSRARERAVVYTDDKAALLDAVDRSDDRQSAMELLQEQRGAMRNRTAAREHGREHEGRQRDDELIYG